MAWNEPPPAEASAEGMALPALASLMMAMVAVCVPPLALAAVVVAWWCWWKCRQDAAIGGFRTTVAALIFSHGVLLGWSVLLGAILDGPRGVMAAIGLAILYGIACSFAVQSAAWKYAIGALCLLLVATSLMGSAIYTARNAAQKNGVIDNLRQLGLAASLSEKSHRTSAEISPDE